jgi:hypothetical protein
MAETDKIAGPGWMARAILAMFLVGLCSRGYGNYNQELKAGGTAWMSVAAGTASAPEQYRVGVVLSALWVSQHTGLRLSQVFGVFDLGLGLLGVLLLYRLLERGRVYREATVAMQWFGAAAFVALALYALDWTSWYARVTTLPTVGLTAAMVWFWMVRGRMLVSAVAFLLLCAAQAFVRADVVVALCAGLLVASLMKRVPEAAMPRAVAIVVSAAGAAMAAGVQVYLIKVRYPQASYGRVPVLMLRHDWWRVTEWAALLIFTAPALWTAMQVWRRRAVAMDAGVGVLLGALGYLLMWILVGRLDEVRIFLPMSLALLPWTVEMTMGRISRFGAREDNSDFGA